MDEKRRRTMMKRYFRMMCLIMAVTFLIPGAPDLVRAKNIETVSVKEYIKLLISAAGFLPDENSWAEAALKAGIIKEREFTDWNGGISKADAAVLANRTDEYLHGINYNKTLYQQVVDKKRLRDINKISNNKQSDIIKTYVKGIMIGSGGGKCAQSRFFRGDTMLTMAEAKIIAARIKYPANRKKLSPDGQVIRTVNLPDNYKDYDYILESFPNSFYEAPFGYLRTKYYFDPEELIDYARPAKIKNMMFDSERGIKMGDIMAVQLDNWCGKVEKNLKNRFNVDYRTIDTKWTDELRSTYYIWNVGNGEDAYENNKRTKDINKYVKAAKKNKVIIKTARITVEPSSLYESAGCYIRVYVKFRIESALDISRQENIIYGDNVAIKNLKKGRWMEKYFDINIGTRVWGLTGEDYAVTGNDLFDMEWK